MSGRVEALQARWAPATGGLPPLTAGVRVALGAIVVAAAGLRIAWCI
ncbi:MAG: hypothetical protein H0V33_06930 [Acidimicrobiia bacterium]|nr:hypothetical protein [Acidimicrobiia bacterium]